MQGSENIVVAINDLSFSYGADPIFSQLSIALHSNQFVAIIGINGSGKSTLMRLLLGLEKAQKGSIAVLGNQPGSRCLRRQLGCATQDIDFPPRLRVIEILRFVCANHQDPISANQLISDFSLDHFKDKYCSELSGGMRRRVALACAFAGKPKVVLLDEPSTGLDAASRENLIQQISRYRKEHKALILMTSHHPEEIIDRVDNLLLLRPGGAPRTLSPSEFQEAARLRRVSFRSNQVLDFPEARSVACSGGDYSLVTSDSDNSIRSLLRQTQSFSKLSIQELSTSDILEHWL